MIQNGCESIEDDGIGRPKHINNNLWKSGKEEK